MHKLMISANGELRLFDLEKDPLETTDVAADPKYRDVIAGLKEQLIDEMLLCGNKASYLNYHSPVVNKKTWAETENERTPMIKYMKEKFARPC